MDARDIRLRDLGIKQPLCSAHKKDGSPCKKRAITGATVCGSHGGMAPQVQQAARKKTVDTINELFPEAVKVLKAAMLDGDAGVAWKVFNAMAMLEGVNEKAGTEKEVELKVVGVDGRPVDPHWAKFTE